MQVEAQRAPKSSIIGRFVRGKRQNSLNEIEGWISDTTTEFGKGSVTRMSAQPPKNVTEQKMLNSKLFEMSKQRYNFILHSKWEQKLFMEKQRQKTAVMKDLLKNVDMDKIQNTYSRQNRNTSTAAPECLQKTVTSIIIDKVDAEVSLPQFDQDKKLKTITFITERPRLTETEADVVQSADKQVIFPRIRNAYTLNLEDRWPVHDSRFTRLGQALSETYATSAPDSGNFKKVERMTFA